MLIEENIPSSLEPIESFSITISAADIQYDSDCDDYYIFVPVTSSSNASIDFYLNNEKLVEVNYKYLNSGINIYIGKSVKEGDVLDVSVFSTGKSLPENKLELFSLDKMPIPQPEWPDYEQELAKFRLNRVATGMKRRVTYNFTLDSFLNSFENNYIARNFLLSNGNLRNVSGFSSTQARSNLNIFSKQEVTGKWDSGNFYTNPDGLMLTYNETRKDWRGNDIPSTAPSTDDNSASLHIYGLNAQIKDKANLDDYCEIPDSQNPGESETIYQENYIATVDGFSKYVHKTPNDDTKISHFFAEPNVSMSPITKDSQFLNSSFNTTTAMDMFYQNESKANRAMLLRSYYNDTLNVDVDPTKHNMDSRGQWDASLLINLDFAVRKNADYALIFFATGSNLITSTLRNYFVQAELRGYIQGGNTTKFCVFSSLRAHYKGKAYSEDESHKREDDSNSLTYYGYDSYSSSVNGTREPSSIFDFTSYNTFYPFGTYEGDLSKPAGVFPNKMFFDGGLDVGNAARGWNARNLSDYQPLIAPSSSNEWKNGARAFLCFEGDLYSENTSFGVIVLFDSDMNKYNNINGWANNEWYIEGELHLTPF